MSRIIRKMSLMRTTQPKHDTHVAPLGLGGLGVPIVYKHVAPLGLCWSIRSKVHWFIMVNSKNK